MIVRLKTQDNQPMVGVIMKFMKDFRDGFCETEQQEHQVRHCQGYQQVVEVTFEGLLTEDQNRTNISKRSKHGENDTEVSTCNLTPFYILNKHLASLTKE